MVLAGAIIAIALGAAYLSIGHDPEPRDVPVAAVGTPAAVQAIEAHAPGQLDVRAVADLDAARQAIGEREVYAAVVPGPHGVRELVIASSASNQVANFMRKTLGAATPDNVPKIVDAKPLPDDDSAGSSIPLLVQLLILGGSVGILGFRSVLPSSSCRRSGAGSASTCRVGPAPRWSGTSCTSPTRRWRSRSPRSPRTWVPGCW